MLSETIEDRAMRLAHAKGMRLVLDNEPDRCRVWCAECDWGRAHGLVVTSRYATEPYGCHVCRNTR